MGHALREFRSLEILEFRFLERENEGVFRRRSRRHEFWWLNAAFIPEDVELTAAKREILTDEEIAKIILEVIGNSEAYGIIDIITVLPGLIRDFKPILEKYASIVLDPSLTVKEKVTAIWEET